MKRNSKFFLIPLLALFILIAAGGFFLRNAPEGPTHPLLTPPAWYGKLDESKLLEEQTTDIKIGTRTLRIPLMYIDSDLKSSREDESVVLEFFLPDFKATPQFANREEYKEAFNERRKSWLLLEASEKRTDFEGMLERRTKISYQDSQYSGELFGLEKYTYQRKEKVIGTKENRIDEIYLLKKDGKITDMITCNFINTSKYPGCNHKFRNRGLLYDLSFNKKNFLHNWQERKKKVTDLIEKMSLDKTAKQPSL